MTNRFLKDMPQLQVSEKIDENTEIITEMSMTRKHFMEIAKVLKGMHEHMHPDAHKKLVKELGNVFKEANPAFSHDRFADASGVKD